MRHTPYRGTFGYRVPDPVNAERKILATWLQNAGKAGLSAVELDQRVEHCAHLFTTSWRTHLRGMVQARPYGGRWYWGPENLPDQGGSEVEDCTIQPAEIAGGQ